MVDPSTFFVGYFGKMTLDWVLGVALEKDLAERLDQIVTNWSKIFQKILPWLPVHFSRI